MADQTPPLVFVSSHEQYGGAEALLDSLLERLDRDRIRSVIFLRDGEFPAQLRLADYPVEVVPLWEDGRRLRGLLELRRALMGSGARVVHANGVKAAIVVALATLGTRLRSVWLKVDFARDGLMARLVAARCAQVVGISEAVTSTFHGRSRGRVRVISPGIRRPEVDVASARELVRRLLSCPSEAKVVVVSGRISVEKGQLEVLEAAPRILARQPLTQFAFLGGDVREYPGHAGLLRRRASELDIADSVHLVGHRRPEIRDVDDAIRFVGGCDVLAVPSRHQPASGWKEGFGLAAAEAMWAGTPVVAYRHGALPEVLGDCARFVREGDREALAEAIADLLASSEARERQIACGRCLVSSRYRWEDAIPALERVYAAAAGG